ncbi:hypothetical protein C2G38_2161690 [Gigaspora rosea]|uniref:Uncharacterized protein n=1 Tax=Gigaspora rosea TaxID=44941 RepID=A0A397VYJ6_9GLOM|nr:hypothetical protein C2G38_2161690 [Gigaspora rosea]
MDPAIEAASGMQSIQYVKSINTIIHKVVSSSSTMFDVAEVLDDQNESYESQIQANSHEDIEHIEDYFDYRQTYLKALLNSVTKNSVKEVCQIIPYMAPSPYQHIIILNDGTHLYEAWACVDSIFNEQFIETSTNHFKQAKYNDIILAYISEQEAKLNTKMQIRKSILIENTNLNNRPASKWLKAHNEEKDNSKVQRKNTEVTSAVNKNHNNGEYKYVAEKLWSFVKVYGNKNRSRYLVRYVILYSITLTTPLFWYSFPGLLWTFRNFTKSGQFGVPPPKDWQCLLLPNSDASTEIELPMRIFGLMLTK